MKFYTYIYRDPSRTFRDHPEPIYVGKGKQGRSHWHLKRNDTHPFTHRLQKMKREGSEPQIEVIGALNEDHAVFMEKCLIAVLGRKDLDLGPLLNLTDGGEGTTGKIVSKETGRKISKALAGRKLPESVRQNQSKGQTGRKHSEERNRKVSEGLMGHAVSDETRAKISAKASLRTGDKNGMFGRKHSEATKAKLRAKRLGKSLSPEAIARGIATKRQKRLQERNA